jgi:hypothetical protein
MFLLLMYVVVAGGIIVLALAIVCLPPIQRE